MPPLTPQGWEPQPEKMGNWRAMFEDRHAKPQASSPQTVDQEAGREQPSDGERRAADPSVYKPWILQRGRSRPAMMLEFRRYEPRSGLWAGSAIAYPSLLALEYTGDKLLSLDFGTTHYVLEGNGLDELARHIQEGVVATIFEYAASLWPERPEGPIVTAARRVSGA